VWSEIDLEKLRKDLDLTGHKVVHVSSKCANKKDFLLNPSLGRSLDHHSSRALQDVPPSSESPDVALIIADGLSANGLHTNAPLFVREFLTAIKSTSLRIAPIVIAKYARVALGDDIASILNARSSLMLIGERPGLASSNSLSVYFTFNPHVGRTDADRNCISNIHSSGIQPAVAAQMAIFLLQASLQKQLSGVSLKIEYPDISQLLPNTSLSQKGANGDKT
jgi:ethanolamine ammonia-lyase small subunit